MTAERWERVKTLFDLALELPAGERSAWIQLNAQDREVAEEATRLLREHEAAAGDFLNNVTQEPATLLDRAARVLADSIHEPVLPRALLAGRYEIIRELGSGGAGIVYLAHDRVLHNRPVVLKFLFSGGESQERLSRRLQQEIQALARIRHPGVVGALDVGSTPDGRMFLVMEYVGGATLRACLNRPLSRRQVADLIEKIADALTAAHQAGVLHRDLKPENVMLESDYQSVKLIDFGIAKVRYSEPGATTHTVTFAGTINYIAPEQLMGKASVASDIYALGIIAYEMLTGRRPFDPETPFDLYELQKTGRIVPPTGLRADLASAVDRAILRALSFDPQKRQATPREFAREISAALGRRPLLRHRTLRHRTRWIAAGAAVAMCLGVASWNRNGIVRRSACDAFGDGWYLCPGPTISTVAGASPAALGHLYGVAADRKGNIYFSSTGKDQVYRLTIGPPLRVELVAGTGQRGFEGDGGDARFAQFDNPIALAVDGNDDLLVVDQHNFRIRKITFNDGIIRTVAGTGAAGSSGDGGPPGKATFRVPSALAFNSEGTLFVADYGASCVRAIRFGSNPVITTPVGGVNGFSGDGGDPKQAQLSGPAGLGFDASGSLFIADQHNNRVRKVTFGSNPKITTVAGAGRASFDGDGGVPTQAGLSGPNGLALDRFGNLYIADSENHRIRKVTFGSRPQIRTVVGNGLAGFSGDGGPASAARLSLPNAMAITTNGDIYVADYLNDRIRRVTPALTASR